MPLPSVLRIDYRMKYMAECGKVLNMPKRSSKRQETDPNRRAYLTMLKTTGQESTYERPAKNPAAVELGRRGGLKGGKARSERLSPRRRTEIARKAAAARWKKKKQQSRD